MNELISQQITPFHIISLSIFLLAILHIFFANGFARLAKKVEKEYHRNRNQWENGTEQKSFTAEILYFLSEIEVVFGIWVIPLLLSITFFYDWKDAVDYIDSRDFTEPIFVVVIMSLAATRPIVSLAENALAFIAKRLKQTVGAWTLVILTIGPLLGSFITEAGAMTLSALLLSYHLFQNKVSFKLSYATLGLLFVNISVGGILTNFAAPPVLIISRQWDWSSWFMFTTFGWKVIIGIILCNTFYWLVFRKEFRSIEQSRKKLEREKRAPVPIWITCVHVFIMFWFVYNEHHPALFIGSYLLFLGFHHATRPHQDNLVLKQPLLVGFFLAGLVIHGGVQGWWINPLLGNLEKNALMTLSTVLTAFNDNAAVTYLSSLIPDLTSSMKQAIISGVVVGGGLTVIANAPNPAGQVILRNFFGGHISPLYLFLGAIVPTLIYYCLFLASLQLR